MNRSQYDEIADGTLFYGETDTPGYDSEIKAFQKPNNYGECRPLETGLYEMGTEVEEHFSNVEFIEEIAPCSKRAD